MRQDNFYKSLDLTPTVIKIVSYELYMYLKTCNVGE